MTADRYKARGDVYSGGENHYVPYTTATMRWSIIGCTDCFRAAATVLRLCLKATCQGP